MNELTIEQRDWLIVSVMREVLNLTKRNSRTSYNDAKEFAKELVDELYSDSLKFPEGTSYLQRLRKKYEQEAQAIRKSQSISIQAEDLISKRISELTRLLYTDTLRDNDTDILQKELNDHYGILHLRLEANQILEYKGYEDVDEEDRHREKIDEHQAISYDSTSTERPDLIFTKNYLGKFKVYKNYIDNTIFRIAVLHPGKAEAITGADLIYEQYNVSSNRVRIASIQYKIWENDVLYFSQSGNIKDQLDKMGKCFCSNAFCDKIPNEFEQADSFRFPHCCAFLKLIDKLQNPKKPVSSGYHIPVCKIDMLKEKAKTDYKLEKNSIVKSSIKAHFFEELFSNEMAGSRWLSTSELESFYKEMGIFDRNNSLTLHVQTEIIKRNA